MRRWRCSWSAERRCSFYLSASIMPGTPSRSSRSRKAQGAALKRPPDLVRAPFLIGSGSRPWDRVETLERNWLACLLGNAEPARRLDDARQRRVDLGELARDARLVR